MDIRDRLGMWYDEVKEYLKLKISKQENPKDGKEELYETRWVWLIILLLLYIAI